MMHHPSSGANPMQPQHQVPFTGNATHSPNTPPMQLAPTPTPPHQLHNIMPTQEQKKKHEREFEKKSQQV